METAQIARNTSERDVWLDFFDIDEGHEIACNDIRGVLHYMTSESTTAIIVHTVKASLKEMTMVVYGPICDDEKPLFIEMRVTNTFHVSKLSPEEKKAFVGALKEHVRTSGEPKLFRSPNSWRSACLTVGLSTRI